MLKSTMFALKNKEGYNHFGPSEWYCSNYNFDNEEIVEVEVEEDPNGKYHAWWEYESYFNPDKSGGFEFVSDCIHLVEICFTYGTKAEEKRGKGKLVRAKVTEV